MAPVDEMWTAYKTTGDPGARNALVLHYQTMAAHLARQFCMGLPVNGADVDDLTSYGIEAMIGAIEKFDPSRGWKFETYAWGRVRNGIIDGLRKQDWLPRAVRRNGRLVARAFAALEVQLGRTPSDADVAEFLGVSEAEVTLWRKEAGEASLRYIDVRYVTDVDSAGDESSVCTADALYSSDDSPEDSLAIREMQRHLSAGIAQLPDRDRVVLALSHRERMTGEQIAGLLGIGITRVSQILTEAVTALAAKLERIPA